MNSIRDGIAMAIALAGFSQPAIGQPPAVQTCEYRNTYVEPSSAIVHATGEQEVEPLRRRILALSADAAAAVGLVIVHERDDAWLRLQVSAFLTNAGDPYVRMNLTPYLKLQHHYFVAMMDDADFPSSGKLGASYGMEFNPFPHDDELETMISAAVHWVWNRTSVEIEALCDLRARLIEEGWTELEELRKQLVLEIERVREMRKRETQRKRLRLRVEGADR